MLDINFIKENAEYMKDIVQKRNMKCDIDRLLAVYEEYKQANLGVEEFNRQINLNTKQMKEVATAEERDQCIRAGRQLKEDMKELNKRAFDLKALYDALMLTVPNTMAEDTPIGEDDSGNVEVYKYGEPTKFDFVPKHHIELGKALDLIDMERASKVAGSKFYYLKNELVVLQMALENFVIRKLAKKGFTPILTPDLAKNAIMIGSGFNPRGEESNTYKLEDLDLNLIATAEITIGGYHAGEQFSYNELPKKYVGISHCFRREAGAPGKLDSGLYRVHQFTKVEMYQFTTIEQGEDALQELLGIEKEIFEDLKIPYHVVRICSGDMGAPGYKKYDIEAWMPCRGENGAYGEVTSVGNFRTFQSRRLNITYIDENGNKQFVNTLNGTAIALTRVLLAIMENYQQADGSILIPEVLREFTGFDVIKK